MREEILKQCDTKWLGKRWMHFPVLSSTNEEAKRMALKESVHGLLITADLQTCGKGRRGRSWQSPEGTDITMSFCAEPEIPAERMPGLTLAAALAAAEAVRNVTGMTAQIKWPNDLVIRGHKICGILTELCFREDSYIVVVGIGINVNTVSFPEDLKETAGSLRLELGKEVSREMLIAEILRCFEQVYEKYLQTGDLTLLKAHYESLLVNKGREVMVLDPKGSYCGTARGITPAGELLVLADGVEKKVASGEVSVRGIYGYV